MRLWLPEYTFQLPYFTNDGTASYAAQIRQFEEYLAQFGGLFVSEDVKGKWFDDGRWYIETMHRVTVRGALDLDQIEAKFFETFPDQLAFYITQNMATITELPK